MYITLLLVTISLNLTADFIDKSSSRSSNVYVMALWGSLIQFLLVLPTIGLVSPLTPVQFLVVFGGGILASAGRIAWFRALSNKSEHLSRMAPLSRLSSVIVFIMAVLLFGETLSVPRAIGGGVLILSAAIVALERRGTTWRDFLSANISLLYVLVFAVTNASTTLTYKYLGEQGVSIWSMYFFMRLAQTLPIGIVVLNQYDSFVDSLRLERSRSFVLGRVLQTGAAFLYLLCIKHLPLTVIEPIAAAVPVVLLFAEHIIHRVQSRNMDEKAAETREAPPSVLQPRRLLVIALTAAGLYLMTL